jgi:hypothetical protein
MKFSSNLKVINRLTIIGNQEDVNRVRSSIAGCGEFKLIDFNSIVRIPEKYEDSFFEIRDSWYSSNFYSEYNHVGNGIYNAKNQIELSENSIQFETSYAPPTKVIDALKNVFTNVEIQFDYEYCIGLNYPTSEYSKWWNSSKNINPDIFSKLNNIKLVRVNFDRFDIIGDGEIICSNGADSYYSMHRLNDGEFYDNTEYGPSPITFDETLIFIGEKSFEHIARQYYKKSIDHRSGEAFRSGYFHCLEDNKDKKYTEEDLSKIFIHGKQLGLTIAGAIKNGGDKPEQKEWFNESIQSLQPKTEWELVCVDNRLMIKK